MVQVDIRLFKVEVVRVFRDARDRVCLEKCEECEKVDGRNENSDRDCPVREHVHCELKSQRSSWQSRCTATGTSLRVLWGRVNSEAPGTHIGSQCCSSGHHDYVM
jgi:hypothetical protein